MKLKKFLTIATTSLATIIPRASAHHTGGSGVIFDSITLIVITISIITITSVSPIVKNIKK